MAKRTSTIGNSPLNPLDAVIPAGAKKAAAKTAEPVADATDAKERVTIYLRVALADKLRDAAWWTRSTLADLAEEAFTEKLAKLEKENGGPFERRGSELKAGRPMRR
jgi:hypothetical protein